MHVCALDACKNYTRPKQSNGKPKVDHSPREKERCTHPPRPNLLLRFGERSLGSPQHKFVLGAHMQILSFFFSGWFLASLQGIKFPLYLFLHELRISPSFFGFLFFLGSFCIQSSKHFTCSAMFFALVPRYVTCALPHLYRLVFVRIHCNLFWRSVFLVGICSC